MQKEEKNAFPYRFIQGERPLFLASASPRRRELCLAMGLRFTVHPTDVDEGLAEGIAPSLGVRMIAERKANAGRSFLPTGGLLIAADTVVDLGGLALGKPRNEADALSMLLSLSGREHRVHTGVAVLCGRRLLSETESTAVFFRRFTEEEALAYIKTGEPMDKAGAYGIQGLGGALVDHIEGAFDNVVGLPTRLLDRLLCEVTDGNEK